MKNIIVALLIFGVFSCSDSKNTSQEASDVKAEIRSLGADVITAINENASGEILYRDFWQSDSTLFLIDGQKIIGYSQIKAVMQQLPEMRKNVVLEPFNEEVYILSEQLAVHLVEFDERKTLMNDSITVKKGLWTTLYKKIDGDWKIMLVHESHVIE